MRMEDIRGRFRTYSESFPEDAIHIEDQLQKIEIEIESTFENDLKRIKKIINDKKIRININYNKFQDITYLLSQVLYADTKIPQRMQDMLKFYIANLFICRDVLLSTIKYIASRVIRNIRNSYTLYKERESNRLIKDFHEFIGCCSNVDEIITNYLEFFSLIEVKLKVKEQATLLKKPQRHEIIEGTKHALLHTLKPHVLRKTGIQNMMPSLVRLALEFACAEDVGIKIAASLRQSQSQSYNNIKELIFTKKMKSYEIIDIMNDMKLCTKQQKDTLKSIFNWGSRSIHQGQILPLSLIWYCLFFVEEDLSNILHTQSELKFEESEKLYNTLSNDGKIKRIDNNQTYFPSYYNMA
jgi:hypothetical protein